jgi:hypothetical protein
VRASKRAEGREQERERAERERERERESRERAAFLKAVFFFEGTPRYTKKKSLAEGREQRAESRERAE